MVQEEVLSQWPRATGQRGYGPDSGEGYGSVGVWMRGVPSR